MGTRLGIDQVEVSVLRTDSRKTDNLRLLVCVNGGETHMDLEDAKSFAAAVAEAVRVMEQELAVPGSTSGFVPHDSDEAAMKTLMALLKGLHKAKDRLARQRAENSGQG